MVIQRLQSLWLLVAAALSVLFCSLPLALITGDVASENSATLLMPLDVPAVLCVGVLTAAIFLISIFLFKDMKLQKRGVLLGILLAFLEIVLVAVLFFIADDKFGVLNWQWSICLPVLSMAFGMAAYNGIRHDEKLLKAADRLR